MEESQMGLFGEIAPKPQGAAVESASPVAGVEPKKPTLRAVAKPAQEVRLAAGREPAARGERAKAAPPAGKPARRALAPPPQTESERRRKSDQVLDGKKVSGLVPTGDVRLTANIREDLHLKLKIASARRRTTIGEILEELIEKHV